MAGWKRRSDTHGQIVRGTESGKENRSVTKPSKDFAEPQTPGYKKFENKCIKLEKEEK